MKSLFVILRLAFTLLATAAMLQARGPLQLVDFTPAGEWPAAMPYSRVTVSGHFAFVTHWRPDAGPALRIFDVSNPSRPVATGELTLPAHHTAEEVVVAGNYAYLRFFFNGGDVLPEPDGGFHVVNISDPAHPVRSGTYYRSRQNISALTIYNGYVCVSYYDDAAWGTEDYAGFRVIDVSNPANPVSVGECRLGKGLTTDMAITGHRACLTHEDSLIVVDLANPLQPVVTGRYRFPGIPNALDARPMGLAVAGNHVFVATSNAWPLVGPFLTGEAGLEVFDISDPATLKPVGRSLWPWGAVRVKVRDGLAFVVPSDGDLWPGTMHDGTEIRVFDVRQPAKPVQVDRGNFRMNYSGFALAGDFLFVPPEGIYRIEKISAASPALEMRATRSETAPELWAECQGYDDFTLTTSTNLTDWQPYATVFSRLPKFKIVPDGTEPALEPRRFYRMSGAAMSLEEMSRQWEAVRPSDYLCGFEHTGPEISGVLTGSMMVYAGQPPSIHYAKLNGVPIADPNPHLFKTVDELFYMLRTSQTSADLLIIKRDPVLHYPAWIYIDRNADSAGDEVTFRINYLVDDIVIVVAPPGGGLGCKCLAP